MIIERIWAFITVIKVIHRPKRYLKVLLKSDLLAFRRFRIVMPLFCKIHLFWQNVWQEKMINR